ncbi:MAG TPA: restriction endonuclease subunit S [Zoogloea sp.]|nr:restriction endonuclease subunit S [Zoogloea sp.]
MHYPSYPQYKNVDKSDVAKIPIHWKLTRLKFMARIKNGQDYKEVISDVGFPVIGSGGEFAKASKWLYNGESVLLGRKGTIDRPLYINGPFWTVDTMFYTVVEHNVSAKFLYYCALTITFVKFTTSTALPSMTQQDLGAISFCAPDFDEQQSIARFLDYKTAQIDALIAKKQALLEKLAEKRSALISHAVTKGLDPSVSMKDSGVKWLGEIPYDWTTKRLRFLSTMAGGMTPSTGKPEYWGGDIPWITPKDMKKEFLSDSIDTLTSEALQDTGIALHESGRVLIVVRGMILAHTFPVAINTVPATVNQDMKALTTSLDNEYLALMLKGIQPLVLSVVEESAHGTKVLRTDIFKNIRLPVPPPDIQTAIVGKVRAWLTDLDAQKRSIESVMDRLQEYRSALITNAVTGKIDVRGFKLPEAAEETAHA